MIGNIYNNARPNAIFGKTYIMGSIMKISKAHFKAVILLIMTALLTSVALTDAAADENNNSQNYDGGYNNHNEPNYPKLTDVKYGYVTLTIINNAPEITSIRLWGVLEDKNKQETNQETDLQANLESSAENNLENNVKNGVKDAVYPDSTVECKAEVKDERPDMLKLKYIWYADGRYYSEGNSINPALEKNFGKKFEKEITCVAIAIDNIGQETSTSTTAEVVQPSTYARAVKYAVGLTGNEVSYAELESGTSGVVFGASSVTITGNAVKAISSKSDGTTGALAVIALLLLISTAYLLVRNIIIYFIRKKENTESVH